VKFSIWTEVLSDIPLSHKASTGPLIVYHINRWTTSSVWSARKYLFICLWCKKSSDTYKQMKTIFYCREV